MQTISSYIVPFLNLRCGRKQLPSIKLKKDRDTDFHPCWYESPNHATPCVFRSQSSVDHRTPWGVLWYSMSPQHHSRNLVFHWRIILNQIIFRPRDKYPSIRILHYCDSLFYVFEWGIMTQTTNCSVCSGHITAILSVLHWYPVMYCTDFKILMFPSDWQLRFSFWFVPKRWYKTRDDLSFLSVTSCLCNALFIIFLWYFNCDLCFLLCFDMFYFIACNWIVKHFVIWKRD